MENSSDIQAQVENTSTATQNSNQKEKLLTLEQASKLAGVSSTTLLRFAEAGYFRLYSNEGERNFSEHEVRLVFAVTKPREFLQKPISAEKTRLEQHNKPSPESIRTEPPPIQPSEPADQPETEYQDLASQIEIINDFDQDGFEITANELESKQNTKTILEESSNDSQKVSQQSELEPLKKILQLQEEIITQKDNTIKDLCKERDWLRTRLERMEEKAERDQMLLMVESQKVRSLISAPNDQQLEQQLKTNIPAIANTNPHTKTPGSSTELQKTSILKKAFSWLTT